MSDCAIFDERFFPGLKGPIPPHPPNLLFPEDKQPPSFPPAPIQYNDWPDLNDDPMALPHAQDQVGVLPPLQDLQGQVGDDPAPAPA